MLETYLNPIYQRVMVLPVALRLRHTRWTPNRVTTLGCITGLCVALMLVLNLPIAAFLFVLVSGYLDTLDGALARLTETSSPIGTVLDIVCDRIVEFAIVFGLFLVEPATRASLTILMLGSILICVTSFLVVGVFQENNSHKSFHYSPGIIDRPEAFCFFAAMILLPQWFTALALIFSLLVFITAFVRLRQFFQYQPSDLQHAKQHT